MKKMSTNQKKVLIANRGDVAVRIAKALNELGHISVGICCEFEDNVVHLDYCDEWIKLEGKNIAETYLNECKIIEIAKQLNVDAIHPGHGLLSESSSFANSCRKNGLIYIGPNSELLALIENKILLKEKASEIGLKILPHSLKITTEREAIANLEKIGFPLILKPVKGRNGKYISLFRNKRDFDDGIATYISQIEKSEFNDSGFFMEKFLDGARHIEVQVLGNNGEFIHFYERECSIQAGFRKIVEEAPSPFLEGKKEIRDKICQHALDIAKKINYQSMGSFEFLVTPDHDIYFLEINPRMQAAQSVTEEILGIDLSILMIQSAFNDNLDIRGQDSVKYRGHALDCRIMAKEALTIEVTPGSLSGAGFIFPQGVRFDHNIYQGAEVSIDSNPIIGKITTSGISRLIAIRKMRAAIASLSNETYLTNISLLERILKDSCFIEGIYDLSFVETREQDPIFNEQSEMVNLIEKVAFIEATKLGL